MPALKANNSYNKHGFFWRIAKVHMGFEEFLRDQSDLNDVQSLTAQQIYPDKSFTKTPDIMFYKSPF